MYASAEKRFSTAYKRAVRIHRIRQLSRRIILFFMVFAVVFLLWRHLSGITDISHTEQVVKTQSALDRKKQTDSEQPLTASAFPSQDNSAVSQSISGDSTSLTLCPAPGKPDLILQNPELPTGCEATAGAMLLSAYGYPADKCGVADDLLTGAPVYSADTVYAPHPNDAFIGSPYSSDGYGTFPAVLADALQLLIDKENGSHTATPLYDKSEEELLSLVEKGIPVCVWTSMYDTEITYENGWYLLRDSEYTDEYFYWPSNEHVVLLIGYDEESVTVYDPLVGKCSYSRVSFFRHYRQVGSYALMLQ